MRAFLFAAADLILGNARLASTIGLMKRPPLLIVLLVLAHVLVDLVVCPQMAIRTSDPRWLALFGVALSISQISLAAVWLCFGRTRFMIRLAITVLVMWTWVMIYYNVTDRPNIPWPLFMMAIASVVVVFLFVLRWFGLAIVVPGEERGSDPSSFQFSIGQLLIWMTVVAVSLGILRGSGIHDARIRDVVDMLAVSLPLAPIALTAMWLALGHRRLGWRITVMILYPLLASVVLSGLVTDDPLSAFAYKIAIFTAIVCLSSLVVVRQDGYRLVWLRRAVEEEVVDVHPLDVVDGDTADASDS